MSTENKKIDTFRTSQMVNTLTTVDECTKFIKNLNRGATETMYYIGKTLLRAKLLNADLNVVEYGKEFGYKQAFVYRVMKVAETFTLTDVNKYGIEKLYLIGNKKELEKYSPEMTLKEVKETKASEKTKKAKNVDPKKAFIKSTEKLIKELSEYVETYGVETENYNLVIKDLERRLEDIQK